MVLHINLRDKAPPFKGGDPVFESRVSFIYGAMVESGLHTELKILREVKFSASSSLASPTKPVR